MKNPQQSSSNGNAEIGSRLRQFINDISIDVWGIEKRINQSTFEYFEKISREENIPKDQLSLCLSHSFIRPEISLQQSDTVYRPVKTSELLEFLGMSGIIPETVEKKITGYFNHLSLQYNIPIHEIKLNLFISERQAKLRFYHNAEFLSSIQIRELVKYFHS